MVTSSLRAARRWRMPMRHRVKAPLPPARRSFVPNPAPISRRPFRSGDRYGRELAELTAANATLPQQQSTAAEAGTPAGNPSPSREAVLPLTEGTLARAVDSYRNAAATSPPPVNSGQQTSPSDLKAQKDFLVQFQQNYLTHSSIGPLLVTCINTVELYYQGLLRLSPEEPILRRCREFVTSLGQLEVDRFKYTNEHLRLENEKIERQLTSQPRRRSGG